MTPVTTISGDGTAENEASASGDAAASRKFIEEARSRFQIAEEAEHDLRRLALEDLEFRAGDQWPQREKANREADGRPCLVINRIPQFIQQVTNDQRQNRPSIKVHAVDNDADIETAKIYQGLIRHIEANSNADVAYDTAFDGAVTGGFGFLRVLTGYVSPTSFDQEILIKRIRNPFSVLLDPFHQEPDGSDANWAFVFEDISRDDYNAKYGESKLASTEGWDMLGNQAPAWMSSKGCRVTEYFYKEFEERDICLLSTGDVVLKAELAQVLQIKEAQGTPAQVVKERRAQIPVIRWCKMNGIEVLEKTDWPGMYIPVIPVYGQELDINGKRVLEGIVRNAKDPARMYNFWKSAETEAIALAPRSPFIVADGQIEGFEDIWATANRRNHAYLPYKPTSSNGQLIGPPQRSAIEPAVQAITQAAMLAADDIKATTGIYDSALGGRSNETSGVAIQRRNVQAQTSNFHFIDNLTRSLKHTGRVLIDLIPKVYDTERTSRIIGEEGDHRIVTLNAPSEDNGKAVDYQLGVGKYDVTVDVGPSFATKRQEAAASMLEVTRAVPQLIPVAGDLIVKSMDWPGAQEIAERIKKTLDPKLVDDPKSKNQQVPPQIQAQMSQMSQMLEQVTSKLNQAEDELDKKRLEIESRERIEMKKLEVQLEIKRAELDAKDSLALLSAQISELEGRQRMLGGDRPIEDLTQDSQMPQQPEAEMGMEQDLTGEASPGLPMDPQGPMTYDDQS